MNCPKCGKRTRVKDSRTADSYRADGRVIGLVTFGHKHTSTPDWVARLRVCSCGWKAKTLELLEEDIATVRARADSPE